jgi:hypothetical protein
MNLFMSLHHRSKYVIAVLFFIWLLFPAFSFASELPTAYLFYGEGCPHCLKEKTFLYGPLREEFPDLVIREFEVYKSPSNVSLMGAVAREVGATVNGVPFLVIGERSMVGYAEGVTSEEIRSAILECASASCRDVVAVFLPETKVSESPVAVISSSDILEDPTLLATEPEEMHKESPVPPEEESREIDVSAPRIPLSLPLFGDMDASQFSLPLLAVTLGALDGFNPCAMWALVFLVGLLLEMRDRRRMWILGTLFIATSAVVYFLFMAAWLHLIIFLGFISFIRIAIGMLALGGGVYSLWEYRVNKEGTCKVTNPGQKRTIMARMKGVVANHQLFLASVGIIGLAFVVNLVELVCSAGLPAVFSQVLVLNDLSTLQYYFYIVLYIFFFMLDDLFVFAVAMTTLRLTGFTTKYVGASRLVGGLLMIMVGLSLIFRPEWLMFG